MPEDVLTRATGAVARERREAFWARHLNGGAARDHPGVDAELFTLYALRSAQGQGVGRALVSAVARELRDRGFRSPALWVLASNPTRAYSAHLGGREAGEKTGPLPGGAELREVRMVWDDLGRLTMGP